MKFMVKIKRDTIKPNPDAGQTTAVVAGRSMTEV